MNRRDHFAAAALTGIVSGVLSRIANGEYGNAEIWAYGALEAGDALMAQLDADKPRTPVDVMADEVMVELENILRLADAMRVAVLPLATGAFFPRAAVDPGTIIGRPMRPSERRKLAQAQAKALSAIADYEAYREGLRSTNSPA